MLNAQNNKPIKIGILEVSSQNKAVLEFFFSDPDRSNFEVSSLDESSSFIIDYDFPGAKESWKEVFETTQKPGIILSIREVELPSTVWVAKPLTSQALIRAGEKIKEMLEAQLVEVEEEEELILGSVNDEELAFEQKVKQEEVKPELTLAESSNENPSALEFSLPLEDSEPEEILAEEEAQKEELVISVSEKELGFEEVVKEEEIEAESALVESSDESPSALEFSLPLEESEPEELLANEEAEKEESILGSVSETELTFEEAVKEAELALVESSDESPSALEFSIPLEESGLEELLANEEAEKEELILGSVSETELTFEEAVKEAELALDKSSDESPSALEFSIPLEESEPEELLANEEAEKEESILSSVSETELTFEEAVKEEEIKAELAFAESSDERSSTLGFGSSVEELKPNSELIVESFNAIPAAREFSVASNLISIDEKNTDNKPDADEDLENHAAEPLTQEEAKDDVHIMADSEIDALLESLIAGGNNDAKQQASDELVETKEEEKDSEVINFDDSLVDEVESDYAEALDEEQEHLTDADKLPTLALEEPESVEANENEEETAAQELQSLLDEITQEADKTQPINSITSNTSGNTEFSSSSHIPTVAEERWALTCGNNRGMVSPNEVDKISFNLGNYMLSTLLATLEQAKNTEKVMRLKFKKHIIVIDHTAGFIYCDNSIFTDSYAEVCGEVISQGEIKIHELDMSEIRQYQKKFVEEPDNSHSVESFIWTTSLLTSRGRLPEKTDMNKKIGLKYWPNLTRLEQIPHAMQIAAVFFKNPGSLIEVSRWLKIEQRYIFAFYNAALAQQLFELDSKKVRSSSINIASGASENNKNRGFFSRLLKRIKS